MAWEDIVNTPIQKTVIVSGVPEYNGVVHDHPRIHVPIHKTDALHSGAKGVVTIRNPNMKKKIVAYGVNHFGWDGVGLYIWPVEHSDKYNESILKDYQEICSPGETITVKFAAKGKSHKKHDVKKIKK